MAMAEQRAPPPSDLAPAKAQPTFVVTGASSGIGRAIVARLVREGWRGFPTVRNDADASALARDFGDAVTPLISDVTNHEALHRAAEKLRLALAGAPLDALVINAGIAIPGPLLHQPIDEVRRVLEVNLVGAIATVQAFAPLLQASGPAQEPGRIVAISSMSGRISAPFVGAYSASKFGLEAVCDCLRRELAVQGIDVVVVQPGWISTPIWSKGRAFDRARYDATAYPHLIEAYAQQVERIERKAALPPERVADATLRALTARRPRTRYPVMKNALFNWIIPLTLPDRWLDRAIARRYSFPVERRK